MKPALALLGCALALSACGSTGVGNPVEDQTLALGITVDDEHATPAPDAALAADAAAAAEDDGGSEATDAGSGAPATDAALPRGAVLDAVLVLGELRWLPCDTTRPPTVVQGPFVLDLISRRSEPAIPAVEVPAGGYCGIDAPLAPARRQAALIGRSLFFDGVRADGAAFIVYADMHATLRVRAPQAGGWDAGANRALLWAFRPRRWLAPPEIDSAETTPWDDQRRAVVIDVDRHPALFLAIRKRLAGKSTMYADRERDGVVDAMDEVVGFGSDDAD